MADTQPPTRDTAGMEPERFRLYEEDLRDLASTVAAAMVEVRQHSIVLDHLRSLHETGQAEQCGNESSSVFILAMDGKTYATELTALSGWVHRVLLPVYGREISSVRPWCERWHEHPEAVARLHALWLAWKQLTGSEAGLTGPSVWHRDHLDTTLLQLRAPDGPFAACTTNASRPHHRILPPPRRCPVDDGRSLS